MSDALDVIRSFCDAFAASGQSLGVAHFREDGMAAYAGDRVVLSGQLLTFYEHMKIDQAAVGGVMCLDLFSAPELERAQEGWRWIGRDGEDNPNWNTAWTVFADRHGDALVAETSDEACPVFGSIQQRNFPIADSLQAFLQALTLAMMVESVEFGFDTRNEDMSVRQDFIDAVLNGVTPLPGIEITGFHKYVFG